ncbi:hypothetical protein BD289DRAFT_446675 [Coniella lustricola]|uniref:Secreted protein n=1 Tax=Coniella lustricola TaxID=2025994 RepID=A0A2T2ZTQ2_9PEZI|nr:hypothetical protein BD289DRAFT_446675 [Coniella lustricola]
MQRCLTLLACLAPLCEPYGMWHGMVCGMVWHGTPAGLGPDLDGILFLLPIAARPFGRLSLFVGQRMVAKSCEMHNRGLKITREDYLQCNQHHGSTMVRPFTCVTPLLGQRQRKKA